MRSTITVGGKMGRRAINRSLSKRSLTNRGIRIWRRIGCGIAAMLLPFCATLPIFQNVHAQSSSVTITVDAAANLHPISPLVYGVAYGGSAALSDMNCPINRYGGNNASRYNWQLNADNRDNDWYFESIPDDSPTPGERGDTFISSSKSGGAQAMITIPMIGWVGKLGPNRSKLSSFSIAKYGMQKGNDWQWFPDAGNGVLTSGADVTGNDPNDASIPADSNYQKAWVRHIVQQWGSASSGGLRYYILDNEPSIWFSTHRDVHPTGPTMDEIRDKILDYGSMIKQVDPSALLVGPEEWGWTGYFLSGFDQQYGAEHNWSGGSPDRANHGGEDYLPWLLDQLHQNDVNTGKRLLDVFSVHYYPQSGEFGDDVSTNMQLLRNRSTRSLWDPNYVDESWIHDRVQLIPRLKGWVSAHYPGTMTAITEYNWGADANINGATAQADVLGVFGREGLDIATRWTCPDPSTPTYQAFKMYRNYDGNKSTFGDSSVQAVAPNPDEVSAFAAVRSSDGALTIMVINKDLSNTAHTAIDISNFAAQSSAEVWQLTSANMISRLSNAPVSGNNGVNLSLPPQSITMVVVRSSGGATPPAAPTNLTASADGETVTLTWTNNSANVAGVYIERALKKNPIFSRVGHAGSNATTYSETVAPGKYLYRVQAFTGGLASSYSNSVKVKVK